MEFSKTTRLIDIQSRTYEIWISFCLFNFVCSDTFVKLDTFSGFTVKLLNLSGHIYSNPDIVLPHGNIFSVILPPPGLMPHLYKGICMTNKGCSGAFALYLAPHKCFSDIIVVFIHSSNWLLLGCENDYFVFIPIWYLEIYKYKYHVFNMPEVPDSHQCFHNYCGNDWNKSSGSRWYLPIVTDDCFLKLHLL